MGDFVFVVLVLGGLGVFFYRQSQEKQAQRSAEISEAVPCAAVAESVSPEETVEESVAQEAECEETPVEPDVEETVPEEVTSEDDTEQDESEEQGPSKENYDALTWRVLQRVMEQPGIMQTEIYGLFPKENRKHLQATLLQLDKENVLRREKEGNTYRLFPV
nr:hypothetical protein [uncultured Desulfuromonas sp.]